MDNKLYKKIGKYIKENLLFIILFIFLVACLTVKLPWSVYTPGGLINVDERLKGSKYSSDGSINLTYVTFMEGKIPNVLLALILPEWDLVKNDDIKIDNETLKDANKREIIYLKESISNATLVAYQAAGGEIDVTSEHDYITYIYEEAETNLKTGDEIIKINDISINSYEDIAAILSEHEIGDSLDIEVLRNDKKVNCYAKIKSIDESKKIGIALTKIYDFKIDPEITYHEQTGESGSSGGLMLSLAIYNSLIKEDITSSLTISGTGTIDQEGNVGAIGGVKYKLAGAVKNKSDIFIVPSDNYEEAINLQKEHNYKIDIIEAKTFNQVLEELNKYHK